ncbi:hypothetical protein niasHT_010096 [Heterodera trifolii]|uniref:Uncharacterized protein n=1 Tax=Heterodera trifolii TaxID=157864 RepID=A0ABD2LW97_9BILA
MASFHRIRQAQTPASAKQLGRRIMPFVEEVWNAVRFGIMCRELRAKFNVEHMRSALLTTACDGGSGWLVVREKLHSPTECTSWHWDGMGVGRRGSLSPVVGALRREEKGQEEGAKTKEDFATSLVRFLQHEQRAAESASLLERRVFGFGCDTVGQLGLGIKEEDEKVVSKPRQITSAHLDGYRVLGVSIADNHALFLAASVDQQPPLPSASPPPPQQQKAQQQQQLQTNGNGILEKPIDGKA